MDEETAAKYQELMTLLQKIASLGFRVCDEDFDRIVIYKRLKKSE